MHKPLKAPDGGDRGSMNMNMTLPGYTAVFCIVSVKNDNEILFCLCENKDATAQLINTFVLASQMVQLLLIKSF